MSKSIDAKLSPKQLQFVKEYIVDYNGTKAAERAGYSPKTANEQASRLLANVNIQAALNNVKKKQDERLEISQDYVLRVIKDTIERCAQAEAVIDKEGNPTGEYRFDAQAVLKGAELLGKHFVMWTDKVKTDATINLKDFKVTDLIGFKE